MRDAGSAVQNRGEEVLKIGSRRGTIRAEGGGGCTSGLSAHLRVCECTRSGCTGKGQRVSANRGGVIRERGGGSVEQNLITARRKPGRPAAQ